MRALKSYYDYYYSDGSDVWIYGLVASCVVLIIVAIVIFLVCRRRRRFQQQEAQPQTQMADMPGYPTPQYATPYTPTPTPMGYPPPMNGGPPVWFNNRSPSKADMEAMSTEQLQDMGAKMGLSDQAHLPRTEYIDLMLATQASVAPAPATFAPMPTPFNAPKPNSISVENPGAGPMACRLCKEPTGNGASKVMAVPPCGHGAYCEPCLRWVATQGDRKCPACRLEFSESQITRVYT